MMHKENGRTLLTPRYYRNEETFIQLANDYKRFIETSDKTIAYQPFVTHQHISQPNLFLNKSNSKIPSPSPNKTDISNLTTRIIRDTLIGERDVFTMYGYDQAKELNETILELKAVDIAQTKVTSKLAEIGSLLDILLNATEKAQAANPINDDILM